MADLIVYAVGDSVMWGEGLNHRDKFAMRAATSLAQARGLTPRLTMLAHCGAKIKATEEEREKFTDLFPHLFKDKGERDRFTVPDNAGPDESPTAHPHLHGEIPRAFPTILNQLRSIPDDEAARVDMLLVTGGANDLDFEEIFQQGGNFLAKLDPDYRRIFHDDIIELLAAARRKCPHALIILTGYYSAFSPASSFDDMKEMFLELSGKDDEYKIFSTIRNGAPLVGFVLDKLFGIEDRIEDAITLARATSESGESRGSYWMRRAVTEINDNPALAEIRGPGVVFAGSGFRPQNCMFAPETFIWQQFEEHKLDDDQRTVRADECPRNDLRDRMKSADNLVELHNDLDGPVTLREALLKAADSGSLVDFFAANVLLAKEVDRIDITRISSIFHPNRRGAARYATVIHKRAEELRQTSLRERLLAFLPPGQRQLPPATLEIGKTIRRFGLRPAVGLKACLAHAEPDVLSLFIRTHPISDVFSHEVSLDLGAAGRWKLRHLLMKDLAGDIELNPHFQPDSNDFFTIDVAGQISIGDITQAVIEFEEDLGSDRWHPEVITLSIDGRDVFSVNEGLNEVNRRLRLRFPK